MSRVFITGSSDGLGLTAGRLLAADGHSVVLHARNETRADDTRAALPEVAGVAVGDLTGLAGMRQVAAQASAAGPFDAVIHNAGIGYREPRRVVTEDGLAHVFAVNVPGAGTPAWTTRSGSGYCAELSRTELPR